MIGNRNTMQSQCSRFLQQRTRRFRTVGKNGMTVNVPTFSGRCRSAYANHVSIVSCFWRDSAQYRVN